MKVDSIAHAIWQVSRADGLPPADRLPGLAKRSRSSRANQEFHLYVYGLRINSPQPPAPSMRLLIAGTGSCLWSIRNGGTVAAKA